MARPAYPLSPAALDEIRRFVEKGSRHYAVAGAPRTPSVRDIAAHLLAKQLTAQLVSPASLWRACKRHGISLPGRVPASGRRHVAGRCRVGKARARKLKGTAGGLPILEMQTQEPA